MRIDTFRGKEKMLLFWEDGDDSTNVKDYMISHNLRGIVYSKYLGFKGETVDIHEPYGFVDEIHIIDSNIKNISFINNFANARIINIQNDDRTKIDFDCFQELEDLFLTWRKGTTNYYNKTKIKTLKIEGFKEKELPRFSDNLPLEELWLSNSSVENVFSLGKLKNLRILHLDYLRNLEDTYWLNELIALEALMVGSCKKMSSTLLANVSGLINLKKLFLSKMGEISTLYSIQNLKALETIGLVEDTKVMDGNLHPLLELPRLSTINIQGFKHYDPQVNSIRNAIKK